MKWEIVEDYAAVSARAAEILLAAIRSNPRAVLGLPTGRTPEGMYERVVARCSRDYHCFAMASTFNLDEYAGVHRSHPGSYFTYMKTRLFDHVDLIPENIHIPHGAADDLQAEAIAYEQEIAAAGGIDLTFLGLGRNGHIGFNEPGAPFQSRTRVVQLTESTRSANAPYFPDGEVPTRAITMGIGTILESLRIVLLASGPAKAEAIKRLHSGPRSTEFPASALLSHADVTVVIDRDAAGSRVT